MGAKPWLTSDTVLSALKRKITFPESQELLSDVEILAFVNEEMSVSMVPSILSYHEEFFVTRMLEGGDTELDIEASLSRYPIPSRAIGSRLRDLFYQDTNESLSEMTRINPDDKVFFTSGEDNSNNFSKFYLESTDLVLVPSVGASPTGSLVFMYFLRPNQLVETDRAAIFESFKKTITVLDVAELSAGDTVTINSTALVVGTDFAIGGTETITATNLAAAINTAELATATSSNTVVTLLFDSPDISIETSNEDGFTIQSTLTVICEEDIPAHIIAGELVDIIQTAGGHQCKALSIPVISVNNDEITFTDALVPNTMVAGDYLCVENECIIPQIPSDLHIDLVERASSRILAAIGDMTGLQIVSAKIQENRVNQGILIDNRVDGSPQKVVARNTLLRLNRRRFY